MITVLHKGGPANDYGVPRFWREYYTKNFISADFTEMTARHIYVKIYTYVHHSIHSTL